MAEKKFVEGAFVSRRETAPEFVITDISFSEKFIDYFKENCNVKGYLNLQLKRSQGGKLYLDLNDWQPSNQGQSNSQGQQEEIEVSEIPF